MQYKQVLQEIYDLQEFAIKLGLENISAFVERLGHPERQYPVIHIAGTNGKGSTAYFIHHLLQAHGLKSGLFTSPHLADYRERIRVNDSFIAQEFIVRFWQEHRSFVWQKKATFFDTTTAMALDYFAQKNVDVAVIETGLGGRLDSTNIVQPTFVVLTPVAFDHQKQLGTTLSAIAKEKAGIIKSAVPVFCAPQPPEALTVFRERAAAQASPFAYLPELVDYRVLQSTLDGMEFEVKDKKQNEVWRFRTEQTADFQVQNLTLALWVSRAFLAQQSIPWSVQKSAHVFAHAFWPGRLQTVHRSPRVIFDVSHNSAGIAGTVSFVLQKAAKGKVFLLLGLLEHKDYKEIVTFLSQQNLNIYLTEPQTPKRLPLKALKQAFAKRGKMVTAFNDPVEAIRQILNQMAAPDILLVTGSHYLIGHLMNQLPFDEQRIFKN